MCGMQEGLRRVMRGSLVWGVITGEGQACGGGEQAGQPERRATLLWSLASLAAARLPWRFAGPGIACDGVSATCIDCSYVSRCFFAWLIWARQSQNEPRMGTERHGWRRVESISLVMCGMLDCLRR
jgi:hypothetical protein